MTPDEETRRVQEAMARKDHWHRIRQGARTAEEKRRADAQWKAAKADVLAMVGKWAA